MKGRRAFSLVELLVVLGIILLVAAILFPVLARAKESGRAATCLSNMRQLSAAILMYVDTNEGPPPNSGSSWEEKIDLSVANSGAGTVLGSRSALLKCPTYRHAGDDDRTSGYAMNGCYLSTKQVADPADSVLVAEVGAWQYEGGSGTYQYPTTRYFLDAPDSFFSRKEFFEDPGASGVHPIGEWGALRHFGQGHYAMVDGHVVTLPPSRFRIPAHDKWCRLNAVNWEGPVDGPHFALLTYDPKR